jgi:hypothetical protein
MKFSGIKSGNVGMGWSFRKTMAAGRGGRLPLREAFLLRLGQKQLMAELPCW